VQVDIRPHQALNFLYGANGAGKTSVLESLVVLSRGRSFRTSQAGELIGGAKNTFSIFASSADESGQTIRLGLERSGKRWRGRKNGKDLSQLSHLTRSLPLVLMEPDSHLLVSGPPEVRRKYLDWGMFHVEHGFLDVWRRYSKALKQRNAALRAGQDTILDSLDDVLADQGERLTAMRRLHSDSIAANIRSLMKEMSFSLQTIEIKYQKGWSGNSYLEALKANRGRDIDHGVTNSGPHRADLLLICGQSPARAVLSRGEQKMFAVSLMLTQAEILGAQGESPVILMDDLASEFDEAHFKNALNRALKTGGQLWLTGTGQSNIEASHKVFHVEQGSVREVL